MEKKGHPGGGGTILPGDLSQKEGYEVRRCLVFKENEKREKKIGLTPSGGEHEPAGDGEGVSNPS